MFRLSFLLIMLSADLCAQLAPGIFLVEFRDKAHTEFQLAAPADFLSERALQRREKQGIAIDSSDLPVNTYYLDSLRKMGFPVHCTSRWLNSALVKPESEALLSQLNSISFIKSYTKAGQIRNSKSSLPEQEQIQSGPDEYMDSLDYGYSWEQIHYHQGELLHQLGYRGEGMQIAVIDGGFFNSDSMSSLARLRDENRILGIRDFVDGDADVYRDHPHGSYVLSIMAGNEQGVYKGTAPGAAYYLLRSEQAASEFIAEEDQWVAAAEYADSAGADVINSSLGYTVFSDASQNHSYSDMNATTRVSRAADWAFSKGMMVLVSAGNEGNKPWRYISAPSDGINVLSVGAVNSKGVIASFSSIGPAPDGRVKPDLVSVGWGTWLQATSGIYSSGNGTSFSSPMLAGLTACLWQANPQLNNRQLRSCILKSCSQYNSPDSIFGYGVPDFGKANEIARAYIQWQHFNQDSVSAGPNPFYDQITVRWYDSSYPGTAQISLFTMEGRLVRSTPFDPGPSAIKEFSMKALSNLPAGLYLLKVNSGSRTFQLKIIKQ